MTYVKQKDGDWIKPVRRGYRMMCCDCGLVHTLNFKIVKRGRGRAVMFQAFRNNRATAGARQRKRSITL
jgi:hypothetical protein